MRGGAFASFAPVWWFLSPRFAPRVSRDVRLRFHTHGSDVISAARLSSSVVTHTHTHNNNEQQRAGGVKGEVKHEDRASVEESKELLAEHMRVLVERASQSGSHLECIIGAGTALGAMVPLLNAAAMEVGTSGINRFVSSLLPSSPHLSSLITPQK